MKFANVGAVSSSLDLTRTAVVFVSASSAHGAPERDDMTKLLITLAMLSISTSALATEPIPLSRVQSVFESKINKTEQMTKICKSLQVCGSKLKDARMETMIMKQKYTEAGGTDSALINRADVAIREAQSVEQ